MRPVTSPAALHASSRSVRTRFGQARGLCPLTSEGAPLGRGAFVRRELGRKRVVQDQLLGRLPAVGDLRSEWLLLLFSVSPRASYLLRMLPPGATQAFAREHDTAVRACLAA